jgi:hypothetical protein
MSLHERIAEALGWSVKDTQSFSFQSLREMVRPVSTKLAHELTVAIQTGSYLVDTEAPRVSSGYDPADPRRP